jgi:hypothetical protein
MATQDDTSESEMQPNTNYDHIVPLLPASDSRQLITSNALMLYPNIVQEHVNKFPNTPVRATDIFDIYVMDVTDPHGSGRGRTYTARLTHAHEKYPAARMLLMSGVRAATVEGALHDLVEQSARGLGRSLEDVPSRKGCDLETTGRYAGWIVHTESCAQGYWRSAELRKLVAEFDDAKAAAELDKANEAKE